MADNEAALAARIQKELRIVPNFPITGIPFIDIMPLLHNPVLHRAIIDDLVLRAKQMQPAVTAIAALESRGFFFGPSVALELGVPFVAVRKAGKLPGKCISISYELEYGKSTVQCQEGAFSPSDRVFIVDDLLATGGTLCAACELVKQSKAQVAAVAVIIELTNLPGRKRVQDHLAADAPTAPLLALVSMDEGHV